MVWSTLRTVMLWKVNWKHTSRFCSDMKHHETKHGRMKMIWNLYRPWDCPCISHVANKSWLSVALFSQFPGFCRCWCFWAGHPSPALKKSFLEKKLSASMCIYGVNPDWKKYTLIFEWVHWNLHMLCHRLPPPARLQRTPSHPMHLQQGSKSTCFNCSCVVLSRAHTLESPTWIKFSGRWWVTECAGG